MSAKRRLVPVLAIVAACLASPGSALAATPQYFPLPAQHKVVQQGIAIDGTGDIWLATESTAPPSPPDLARLSVAQAVPGTSAGFDFFPTPSVASEPCCARLMRDLAFDAEHDRIWFARSAGVVGYASLPMLAPGQPTGIAATSLTGFPDLGGIAVGHDDLVWFTESSASNVSPYPGNRIGYTSQGLGITEFPDLWHQFGVPEDSSRYDAKPSGIAIDAQGSPWFTEANPGNPGYRIGKGILGGPGTYQEYPVRPCGPGSPCSGSFTGTGVLGITVALDGSIWFTNVLKNSIGKLDLATQTFSEYPLTAIDPKLAGGEPRAIRVARDGTLWVAERGFISHPAANALVRLVPSDPPTATVYQLGSDNAPLQLAPDDNGNVWFLVSGASTSSVGLLSGVVGAAPPEGEEPKPPAGEVVVHAAGTGRAQVEDPHVRNGKVELTQLCVGPPQDPCILVYLLDSHEYVNGLPGTKPRLAGISAKRKTRRVVVGQKTVTIPGGKSAKVTIELNAKGKKILKRDGVLHLTFHASQKVPKGKKKVLKPLKAKKLTIRSAK